MDDRQRTLDRLGCLLACTHLRAPPHDRGRWRLRLEPRGRRLGGNRLGDDALDLGVGEFRLALHRVPRKADAILGRAGNSSSLMLPVLRPSTWAFSACDEPFA